MRDTFLRQSRREAIRDSVTQTLGASKIVGVGSAIGSSGAGGPRIQSISTMGQPPRTQQSSINRNGGRLQTSVSQYIYNDV
jgi:hypothetical protein